MSCGMQRQCSNLQLRPGALPGQYRPSKPFTYRGPGRRLGAPGCGRQQLAVVAASWWPSAKPKEPAGGGSGGATTSGGGVGLFPAGKRQARVQLPALMLTVQGSDVLDPAQAAGALEAVNAAVAGGATAVVLQQGAEGSGELYEAAVRLKELLRGRAALLVEDRTDIVDVVGADGALLSPDGLPTVVAKRLLQNGLALVGRAVGSADAAAEAAADGANFVVLRPSDGGAAPSGAEAAAARSRQKSSASIPVIAAASGAASGDHLAALIQAEVDGLVVGLADLGAVAAALCHRQHASVTEAAVALMQQLGGGGAEPAVAPAPTAAAAGTQQQEAQQQATAVQLSQLLSSSREELVDAERQLFTEVRGFTCGCGYL